MMIFDQDAPCAADHDTVPVQYRDCPVCGEDLDRPSPERGVVVLSFPSTVRVHPLDVDRKPRVREDMAQVIRTARCLLLDLRDWARREPRR